MQWQRGEGVGHLDYCYGEDVDIKCNRCGKALCKYRGPQPITKILKTKEEGLNWLEILRQYRYELYAIEEGDAIK